MALRVLHVGKFYPPHLGGMESFLGELLPVLGMIGIEPGALVHAGSAAAGEAVTAGENGGVRLWRVPSYGTLLYTPVSPGFPGWMHRAIQQFRPEILHLHLPNPSAFWVMALPGVRRIPRVVHWHADVVPSTIDRRLALVYRLYRPFEQRLLAGSARVIATSPPYRAASEPLARWRDKTAVIPLGLDPGRIVRPARQDFEQAAAIWGGRRFKVLTVGRLTYYKGHEVLVRAMRDMDDAALVLVGTGERQPQLAELVRTLRPSCRVHLAGGLGDALRNALYATCDCFCLPSIERTEAFGMVLLEAMSFQRPVVASNIEGSGVGWVVRPEETGLLVPPQAEEDLRRALNRLRDTGLAVRMGQAGFARLHEKFSIQKVAQAVKEIYDAVRLSTAGNSTP